MVGVPGKYKGCNTCRARRVKCDNERPYCRKCQDSGRECQGYERETIFIIGTPEGAGRVSSHPPRNLHNSTNTPSPPHAGPSSSSSELTPIRPLRCAWDDSIAVSKSGRTHQLRITSLHTSLNTIFKYQNEGGKGEKLSLSPYAPAQVQPQYGNDEFFLRSLCLAHVSSSQEGMLLFIFEHNSSLAYIGSECWNSPVSQASLVKQLGPSHFAAFPAHHFFARVYRPAAIATALLNRKPTFCAEQVWIESPWQRHPKAPFDNLCDILAQIPSIFHRLDEILSLDPTVSRRFLAQSALEDCLTIQGALDQWHTSLHQFNYASQAAYWISRNQSGAQVPFSEVLSFRDPLAAVTFTWYWTVQVLFYPCLELLSHTIFSPAVDDDQVFPDVPAHLAINPGDYSSDQIRVIASNICRGLDAVVANTSQPDLLAFPIHVVEGFYGGLSVVAQTGDGALELMWLAGFRNRLAARGQRLTAGVMGRSWKDVAEW